MAYTRHTVYLTYDGTVKATGYNQNGQLGIGNNTNQNTPQNVAIVNVKAVYQGYDFTVFLLNDGTVKACGNNNYGQLGLGNNTSYNTPQTVPGLSNVKSVACGSNYVIYVLNNGDCYGCGYNTNGQLGIAGNTTNQTSPMKCTKTGVNKVACGYDHTLFLLNNANKDLYACGRNAYGQLMDSTTTTQTTPILVSTGILNMWCGAYNTIVSDTTDHFTVAGLNNYGQLGINSTSNATTPNGMDGFYPDQTATNPYAIKDISMGYFHTMFVRYDGTIYACGRNNNGQLGNGTTENKIVPTVISSTYITDVHSIMAGDYNTKYLKWDGTVYATGDNTYGTFGNGNNTNSTSPVQVSVANVKSLSYDSNIAFNKDDTGLGTMYTFVDQTLTYVVSSPYSSLTIKEYFDDTLLNTYTNRLAGTTYTFPSWSSYYANAGLGDHNLKVVAWNGGKAYATLLFSFKKAVNAAPVISGSDGNWSGIYTAQEPLYTVTDDNNSTVSVTEYFDSTVLRTYTANSGVQYGFQDYQTQFAALADGSSHSIKIVASDGSLSSTRTYTFVKSANPLTFSNTGSLSLGTIDDAFTVSFTVNNGEATTVTGVVKLDDVTINNLGTVTLNTSIPVTLNKSTVSSLVKGNHTLKIVCTSSSSFTNTLTYSFTKADNAPIITATGSIDLGSIVNAQSIPFNASDLDTDTMTATIKLDGNTVTTKSVVQGANTFDMTSYFASWVLGPHTLTIVVNDGTKDSNVLSYTFTIIDSYVQLSATNTDIGAVSQIFSVAYYCTNVLNNAVSVNIKIDSNNFTTMNNVSLTNVNNFAIDSTTYSGLSIGAHTILLTATDTANNVDTLTFTFTKAPNAPVISGTDKDFGKVNGMMVIQYTVTDPNNLTNTVTTSLDGNSVDSKTITLGTMYSVNSVISQTMFQNLTEGRHTITVVANNGSLSATRTYTFYKINQVIVATTTQSNIGNLSGAFTINYTAVNQLNNITYVVVRIDGTVYQGTQVVTQNSTQIVNIDEDTFDKLAKGNHAIDVIFTDTSNNAAGLNYTFFKNATPPKISGSDQDFGDVATIPQISYSVDDKDGDPVSVSINFDTTNIYQANNIELNKVYSIEYDSQFANAAFGSHTITITATSPSVSVVRTYTFNKLSSSITVIMDMNQIHPQMNNFNNIQMNILDHAGPRVTLNIFVDNALVHEILDIYNGDYTYSMPSDIWNSLPDGLRQVKMEFISYANGSKNNINFSMNKVGGYIDFMLKYPVIMKGAVTSPYRILLHSDYEVAEGANIQVLTTGNPFDDVPVWEDMTTEFLNKDYHVFKTLATNDRIYGANIRIKIDVGSSNDLSWIGRFGIFLE